MLNRRDELDHFKREINLAEFAASSGYLPDRKATSRSSIVMAHPNGDKVIIARGRDGHWIYFSVRDDFDNGTIIDFLQHRGGGSLGEVRKLLRAWTPGHMKATVLPSPEPVNKDLVRVRAQLERMPCVETHHYLEEVRAIPADVLQHARFFGCIRTDERTNAVFPHFNRSEVCGFEIKNEGFTGFSPGGEKGLWLGNVFHDDTGLVIAESAIDALSHFTLKRREWIRYASIAGAMNSEQLELLRLEVEKLSAGSEIIIATDNDEGGDKLTSAIRHALSPFVSSHHIIEERPAARGADWNDLLVAATRTGR